MASIASDSAPHDDDLDARFERIRQRLLDGIEHTLDDLAQPDLQRAAIAGNVWSRYAPLLCRRATCRRAKRCRGQPCKVREAAARGSV